MGTAISSYYSTGAHPDVNFDLGTGTVVGCSGTWRLRHRLLKTTEAVYIYIWQYRICTETNDLWETEDMMLLLCQYWILKTWKLCWLCSSVSLRETKSFVEALSCLQQGGSFAVGSTRDMLREVGHIVTRYGYNNKMVLS